MITPEPTLEPFSQIATSWVRTTNWGAIVAGGLAGVVRYVLDPYEMKQSKFVAFTFSAICGAAAANYIGIAVVDYLNLQKLAGAISFASGLMSMNIVLAFIKFGKTFDFKNYFTSLLPRPKV